LVDVLFGAAASGAALCVAACLLGASAWRDLSVDDARQLAQMHRGYLAWSTGNSTTSLPRPGLIQRHSISGGFVPNAGAEDQTKNNSANTYSCMLAQQFIAPSELISPVETNPVVRVVQNYNYAAYNPSASTPTFWDPNFKANIHKLLDGTSDGICNTSYSHLALVGSRKVEKWRVTAGSNAPHFSNRGVYRGQTSGANYSLSYSLLFHPPATSWEGNVCFADNHVVLEPDFFPEASVYSCGASVNAPDNIFAWEFTGALCDGIKAGDTWLTIAIGVPSANELTYTEAPERRIDGTSSQ
jgi:hypothetical protein